jgi:predicted ATPase
MLMTHVRLKNWRNFRALDLPLREVTYVLGPNASGKSNLLDVFRFLRDLSKPKGGGLQAAVAMRGDFTSLQCLHAGTDEEVLIDVELPGHADGPVLWRYVLGFRAEGRSGQRIMVSSEQVWHAGELILQRPNAADAADPLLLTQTHLEQIQANARFRGLGELFGDIGYLQLVPQLLKFGDRSGGQRLEDDPFGQGFLERIAKTSERTRSARLGKINKALRHAVPQFEELRFSKDEGGHPHLEAQFAQQRSAVRRHTEDQFSDGTLRLLGLLWALLESHALLLLEEPEIALSDGVVKEIPLLIERIQRERKSPCQVILSTHSEALLSNQGIDGRGVIVLESSHEGSRARTLDVAEENALRSGFSVAEVVLPKTRPENVGQLGFCF